MSVLPRVENFEVASWSGLGIGTGISSEAKAEGTAARAEGTAARSGGAAVTVRGPHTTKTNNRTVHDFSNIVDSRFLQNWRGEQFSGSYICRYFRWTTFD